MDDVRFQPLPPHRSARDIWGRTGEKREEGSGGVDSLRGDSPTHSGSCRHENRRTSSDYRMGKSSKLATGTIESACKRPPYGRPWAGGLEKDDRNDARVDAGVDGADRRESNLLEDFAPLRL
jgi:hypothetical protein